MKAEIINSELLFHYKNIQVEKRLIRLNNDIKITRELLLTNEHFAVVVVSDSKYRVILQQIYHYGNNQYIWGVPRISITSKHFTEEDVKYFVEDTFNCFVFSVDKIFSSYDDATIVVDRKIDFYLAKVDELTENHSLIRFPLEQSLKFLSKDSITDNFTILALLWLKYQISQPLLHSSIQTVQNGYKNVYPLPKAKILNEEILYKGKVFDIINRNVLLADGQKKSFRVVRRADTVLAVVIDKDTKEAIFLEEYFPGTDSSPCGLVGGHVKRYDKDTEKHYINHMNRELREESGYCGKLTRLLSCHGSIDLSRIVHHFLANDLEWSPLETGHEEYVPKNIRVSTKKLLDAQFLSEILVSEVVTILTALNRLNFNQK